MKGCLTGRRIPSACKIPYCLESVRAGKALMCPGHWAKVPRKERDAIYAALRDWNGGKHGVGAANYLDAVRAAIDAVIQLEGQETAVARARARQTELPL